MFTHRYVLESDHMKKFFDYIQLPNFDIASDASATFKVICWSPPCKKFVGFSSSFPNLYAWIILRMLHRLHITSLCPLAAGITIFYFSFPKVTLIKMWQFFFHWNLIQAAIFTTCCCEEIIWCLGFLVKCRSTLAFLANIFHPLVPFSYVSSCVIILIYSKQELLTRHKATVAEFLSKNYDWVSIFTWHHHC